jgi:hypothetical protein
MTRKLKGLGVAMIAVFAIAGTGASAASAAEFHFDSNPSYPTASAEKGQFYWKYGATEEACKETLNSEKISSTTTPSLSFAGVTECGFFTWNYNGCSKKIAVNTATTGTLSFVCPAGKEIELVGALGAGKNCRFYVPAQTSTSPVGLLNSKSLTTGKKVVTAAMNAKEMTYTVGSECNKKAGIYHDGQIQGSTLISNYSDAARLKSSSVWVE